jgi:hypothetical protein
VTQYTLLESTAMVRGASCPEARTTGVPPPSGTDITCPPTKFVQYAVVASTTMA